MNHARTLAIGLSLLLLTGLGSTARAQDVSPELREVLERCIAQLRQGAKLANDQIAANRRCVAAVKRLLEAGEKEAAIRKARECLKESRETRRRMLHICRQCLAALRKAGAPPRLIHRFKLVWQRQIRRVGHSEKPLVRFLRHAHDRADDRPNDRTRD